MKPTISSRLDFVRQTTESLPEPVSNDFHNLELFPAKLHLIDAYHALQVAIEVIEQLNEYAISVTPPVTDDAPSLQSIRPYDLT